MSIPEARLLAAQLIKARQPQDALAVAEILIQRDPTDVDGLILKAQALRQMKRYDEARQTARKAWDHAKTDRARFAAAMTNAQVRSTAGNKTQGQIWLRRAIQNAPDARRRAQAVRDYRYLRRTNPVSFSLRSSVTPSNNLNNAPRDNTFEVGGLLFVDPSSQPLSGGYVSLGATVRYNFGISTHRQSYLSGSWDEHRAFITDTAEADAIGVSASDFDYRRYGLEIGHDIAPGPNAPRSTISFRLNRTDYGSEPLSNEYTLRFAQSRLTAPARRFGWSVEAARAHRFDNDLRSATILKAQTQWVRGFEAGRLSWSFGAETQVSDSAAIEHDAFSVGAAWTFAKPVLGTELSLAAQIERSLYDTPLYGPEARADTDVRLIAGFLFREMDVYGFAPKLSVTAERTKSNITLFDSEALGVSLSLQSTF